MSGTQPISKLPPPILLQMSSTTSGPVSRPTPLPIRPIPTPSKAQHSAPVKPHPRAKDIKLRLKIQDLKCKGTQEFLGAVNAGTVVEDAVVNVLYWLYDPRTSPPGTRSVTVVLRSMDGVAYTSGKEIDNDHKVIHFSTDYIGGISVDRKKHEISGVICHEMVHCLQFDAFNSAPGGLIEGIADWVRLRSGFAPPHWKRSADDRWDAGYATTGYFLEYLEERFGPGTVRRVNEKLRERRYNEETFWTELFGCEVTKLWEDYAKTLKDDKDPDKDADDEADDEAVLVEKEDGCDIVAKSESDAPSSTGTQKSMGDDLVPTETPKDCCINSLAKDHGPSTQVTHSITSSSPVIETPRPAGIPKPLRDMLWAEFFHLKWEAGRESDGYMASTFVYYFETLLGRLFPDLSDADKVALLLSKLPMETQNSLRILSAILRDEEETTFEKPWSFEQVKELLVRSGRPGFVIRIYQRATNYDVGYD